MRPGWSSLIEPTDAQRRILSRLQWGLVADIHPTDYELRLGILQSKAERIMAEDPSIDIDNKVLEFLAPRLAEGGVEVPLSSRWLLQPMLRVDTWAGDRDPAHRCR